MNYLCDFREFVLHGSNLEGLRTLVPEHDPNRDITEFGSRDFTFASPDAIYAMWFAVLDRNSEHKGTANGCSLKNHPDGSRSKRYWFSVDSRRLENGKTPLINGFLYLALKSDFPHHNGQEWGSTKPIETMAMIPVTPEDFPLRNALIGFDRTRLSTRIENKEEGFPWFDDEELYPIVPESYLSK